MHFSLPKFENPEKVQTKRKNEKKQKKTENKKQKKKNEKKGFFLLFLNPQAKFSLVIHLPIKGNRIKVAPERLR